MKAKLKWISLFIVALLLVGCSAAIAQETTPAPTSAPTATPLPGPKAADPTLEPGGYGAEELVALATADLEKRLGSDVGVALQEVVPVDFSDASLGVPEPGQEYAQVVTSGYVIRLKAADRVYEYHAAGERVVLASGDVDGPGRVTITHAHITADDITLGGESTLPDGTSIRVEVLAGGQGALWWPESACAVVQQGAWQIGASLVSDGANAALDRELEHVAYAWPEHDPTNRTSFPFDLAGPRNTPVLPTPDPGEYSRVEIAGVGLSFEGPTGWMRLEPGWLWTPDADSALYLGVQWVDLQPPQEAEPALLPQPSQVLESDEVTLSWGSGRRYRLEVYAPAAPGQDEQAPVASVETHVLFVVNQEGQRRALDLYIKGDNSGNLSALEPVLEHALNTATMVEPNPQSPAAPGQAPGEQGLPQGWAVFQDELYGYQIAHPPDWTWVERPAQGPGTPDDWPVTRIVHLYPQAWDAQLNRSGPPDPTAKPVVAPVQIEVVVGPPEQFRRVYPEPAESETIEVNGLPVTVERDTFNGMSLTRYVFAHPEHPEVYLTLTDMMTGFPDRVAGSESIAAQIPQIVSSFGFGGAPQ